MSISVVAPTHAALISLDLYTTGDGLITRDDVTGLEWLDLQIAAQFGNGITNFDIISAEFEPGGAFDGFRYASEVEVSTLWTDAGITDQSTPSSDQTEAIYQLMLLIGQSGGGTLGEAGANAQAIGINGTLFGDPHIHRVSGLTFCASCGPSGVDVASANLFASAATDNGTFTIGHWLVKADIPTPVPEPGTLALLGSGLLGVGVRQWRKRRVKD